MLYFDDFMEAVENLPSELSDSLTHVRHLDLQTQNILEPLSTRVRVFFEGCKHGRYCQTERELEHNRLLGEYEKALCFSKEKKEIVENICDTYRKLVRKLDAELEKFRLELEADNSGITEQIERRISAIFEKPTSNNSKFEKHRQKFRPYQSVLANRSSLAARRRHQFNALRHVLRSNHAPRQPVVLADEVSGLDISSANYGLSGVNLESSGLFQPGISPRPLSASHSVSSLQDSLRESIADDALSSLSAAHAARGRAREYGWLDQLTSDSGREASKSASSNNLQLFQNPPNTTPGSTQSALKPEPFITEPTIPALAISASPRSTCESEGGSLIGSYGRPNRTSAAVPLGAQTPESVGWVQTARERRHRPPRRLSRALSLENELEDTLLGADETPIFGDTGSSTGHGSANDGLFEPSSTGLMRGMKLHDVEEEAEDMEDEDQKRYCLCRDVSYGDMIACDASNCPYEWFHYSCVGLTVAPKGQWFCPNCKSLMSTKSMKKKSLRRP